MFSNKSWYYYQIARQGSLDLKTPVMKQLLKQSKTKKRILDIGCGDGTRLSIIGRDKEAVGIDASAFAIKEGKKRYSKIKLFRGKAEKLPFNDGDFDFVYSTFVLEHLKNPEKVIKEAIRVLEVGGILFLAAPNFGAPNRRSPCSSENKYLKLIKGFINDFLIFARTGEILLWKKVKPRFSEPYQIDFDTRVEPYILPLIKFLKGKNLRIIKASTLWEIKEENRSFFFKLIRNLGMKGVFPFVYWGPQLLIVAKKVKNDRF